MNLRDLHYVVAIAEHGHFGQAAKACAVSQPTLSGQIAKLEAELGVAIFERSGRRIVVTEAGQEIVAHARRALAAAGDIADAARAHRDPLMGRLRLGVIPTLCPYLMPYLLPLAAAQLPNAPLALVEDLTGVVTPMVLDNKLDAALIATMPEEPELAVIDLFDEPFWIVTPTNHPLLARKSVRTKDIDPRSLLLLADGHCLRDQALDLCGHPEVGGGVNADMRATSLETLLHLTAAGYGVTLAPQLAIERGRVSADTLACRPLAGDDAARRVRMIYRRGSPRARAIIELARLTRAALPASLRRLGA